MNSQPLGSLCKNKFTNWKKAVECFDKHSGNRYHINCVQDADCFLSVKDNPTKSVENQLDTEKQKKVAENRKKTNTHN